MSEHDTIEHRAMRSIAGRVLHHARCVDAPRHEDDTLVVTRVGEQGLFINCGVLLAEPVSWDATLDTIGAVIPPGYTATLISPNTTPDLSTAGWQLVGHPPLMVRPVDPAPPVATPPELRIEEAVDRAGLEQFERTLVEAYPMPPMLPYEWGHFFDERVLGGPTRFWVGTVDGRPVSVAAAHTEAGVNDVEMVATFDRERGKGYGAALTWTATVADPSVPAILIASDDGRPVYERLGYASITRWTIWMRP